MHPSESCLKLDQKINSLPLDISLHPVKKQILFATTEVMLFYIPLKETVLYALVAIVGSVFRASTIKFYASASPSQHYQFEFLTLPSLGQHPKKFLFTIQ